MVLRPLFAAALVVCRRYLIVVLRRSALQVIDRGAKTDSCDAAQVLDRVAQADSRSDAQELDSDAEADARGAARSASQVLDRRARPSPAAPLVVRRRYLIVCRDRCPRQPSLCIAGLCSFIVVSRPLPAAALVVRGRYFIVAPGRCPRRRAGS
jgi:hypothetical protein